MDDKLAWLRGAPYAVPNGVGVSGEPGFLAFIHDIWCVGPMALAKIGFGDDGGAGPRPFSYPRVTQRCDGQEAQTVCVNIDRSTVDDALSAALGREVLSQIEFNTTTSTTTDEARAWTSMLTMLLEQLIRPDSLLSHPLVTMPFVDCLVRGLLMAADHPHHAALKEEAPRRAPQAIRTVIELIEAEPGLPWTVPRSRRAASLVCALCRWDFSATPAYPR